MDRLMEFLRTCCMYCGREIQKHHYCGACELQDGPCVYHREFAEA